MAGLWIAAVTAGCGGEEFPSVELALAAERSGSGRPVASAPDRLAPRPVARRPQAIAVTPDGLKAYVASERDLRVTVLDAVSHRILKEVTLGPARGRTEIPVVVAVDPEGRHLFHVDPLRRTIAVLETSSDTHVASIPVPGGSRDIAFDFSGGSRRVFVTNQRENAVLVFLEAPAGVFSAQAAFSLAGRGPDPIAVIPGGQLLVGHRHSSADEFRRKAMDQDNLNMEIRKFLKKVGITSQREIEIAVKGALDAGKLSGGETLKANMRLQIGEVDLDLTIEGDIGLS